jgi:hypothetical protein
MLTGGGFQMNVFLNVLIGFIHIGSFMVLLGLLNKKVKASGIRPTIRLTFVVLTSLFISAMLGVIIADAAKSYSGFHPQNVPASIGGTIALLLALCQPWLDFGLAKRGEK